jgi:ureidoglycolate lyase
MRSLLAEPITTEAFAPFGVLLERPGGFGRRYFDEGLGNLRAGAWASLSVAVIEPVGALPLDAVRMERHEFSSQSFIPMDAARYLVLVAPHAADGAPDAGRARAFTVDGGTGITYRANVWHHPMVVLDRPATFAIIMWRDGGTADEEFAALRTPLRIELPG